MKQPHNYSRPRVPKEVADFRQKVMQELRKSTKLTQKKFAEKIGRAYSYVRRQETKCVETTIEDIRAWAKGCDLDAVLVFSMLVQDPTPTELPVEDQ